MKENITYKQIVTKQSYDRLYFLLKDEGISERHLSKLRTNNEYMFVNGQKATMRTKINQGDTISFAISFDEKSHFPTCDTPIDIVYEDDDLIIVNKPSLFATIPTRNHHHNNLASAVCNYMLPKMPNFVFRALNRLDKDTAGLVVVAKNLYAYNQTKITDKEYLAICSGKIDKDMIIDAPILTEVDENGINKMKRIVSPFGKEAKTIIHLLAQDGDFSYISAKIEHGRTHQIRVHLSSVNHPLLGDCVYGKPSNIIFHTALVCHKIKIVHPSTKVEFEIKCDIPNDFENALRQLNLQTNSI